MAAAIKEAFRSATPQITGYFHRRGWLRALLIVLVSGLISSVLMKLTVAVLFGNGIAVCWPMVGIATTVLLRRPRHEWPWILFGVFFGHFWMEDGLTFIQMSADILGDMAEIVIAAFSLPAFKNLADWMKQPHLLTRFVLGAVVTGPLLTSLPVGLAYGLSRHEPVWPIAVRWCFADGLGVILWLPLTTALLSRETYSLFAPKAVLRTIGLIGLLAGAAFVIFGSKPSPSAFLIMPILLLTALRLGFSASAIAVNILTIISAIGTIHGHGPFGHESETMRIMILQGFLACCMLMCFPISIILLERDEFERDLKEAYHRVEQLAINDALTGLANRRHFDNTFGEEWRRAMRDGQPLGLLMIDVDYFKRYNDLYGHLAGDECLRKTAAAIALGARRAGDLAARYGGEEFVVLFPRTDLAALVEMAEGIRFQVQALALEHEKNPCNVVTISAGCATVVPALGLTKETLIESADQALYIAKQNGRNRVQASSSGCSEPAQREERIA